MDIETWKRLLGKSADDRDVQAALAAAGIKKAPKLAKDDVSVIIDLKGHGMGLKMVDEAFLKELEDPDVGEGRLILSNVSAYVQRKKNNDLYKGTLPYKLAPGMIRAEVVKTLGPPTKSDDEVPYDSWLRDGVLIVTGYTRDLKLGHINLGVPPSR